jgi:hypothetical protein
VEFRGLVAKLRSELEAAGSAIPADQPRLTKAFLSKKRHPSSALTKAAEKGSRKFEARCREVFGFRLPDTRDAADAAKALRDSYEEAEGAAACLVKVDERTAEPLRGLLQAGSSAAKAFVSQCEAAESLQGIVPR